MPETFNNFPDTLYKRERQAAKGHATYPLTHEYIERLETIAAAAFAYWKNSPSQNDLIISYRNDLYDALPSTF